MLVIESIYLTIKLVVYAHPFRETPAFQGVFLALVMGDGVLLWLAAHAACFWAGSAVGDRADGEWSGTAAE